MRRLGFPSIYSPDAPSLSFTGAGGGFDVQTHVDGATMKNHGIAYALAFTLSFAGMASADSTELAAAILSNDAMPQGPSVADRLTIIREKIQNALEYPPLARLHDSDGEAQVRFEIDREGVARGVRVVRSSGHERLDASAVRAVESASPLPWVYGPLEVPVHFELTAPR